MWRAVYQKAAQAAEARAAALLAGHVYQLHGRRAVAVVLDGGGAPLAPGDRCDLEVPWAFVLEGWALYADQPGLLVLDVLVCADYAAYPDFVSIVGDPPPGLGDPLDPLTPADKGRDDNLADWTVRLPRGRVLRVAVVSNDPADPEAPEAAPGRATLTLFVRAA
jgi:hypothetical protein